MKNFIQRYRNARTAIAQIKAGEWKPQYNSICERHLDARRGSLELWIGNSAWFCEMRDTAPYFGFVWRHYVWWAAARHMLREADKPTKHSHEAPML